MARQARKVGTTLVLDCEGLSGYIANDRRTIKFVETAEDCVISVVTTLEANHGGIDRRRWDYVLSQVRVVPVTWDVAKEAGELLRQTGLHGHKYALDAIVAATAMREDGMVLMLTSDIDDMEKLCGERVELVKL